MDNEGVMDNGVMDNEGETMFEKYGAKCLVGKSSIRCVNFPEVNLVLINT